MLERARTSWSLALVLLAGCGPVPTEVTTTGLETGATVSSGDPTGDSTGTASDGAATTATGEGTSSEGTTVALDGGSSTTIGEATTASGSSGGSSSEGGEESTTTGEPDDCHPILAEVLYEANGGDNNKQWVRLYNPCGAEIELEDTYTLAWAGANYTDGRLALEGSIDAGGCRLVGGPESSNDNGNPVFDQFDQGVSFSPDLESGGDVADGVALFLGGVDDVMVDTVPLDAVIYGGSNDSNLLDAEGNAPEPHVGNVMDEAQSIRRTALGPEWEVARSPTPNGCPAL